VNLLAIETATDAVGVAVLGDGGAVERVHLGGRQHAERLVPMIEEACAAAGTPLSAVDVVAVDVGPGLFTGLRVGVATAKALAQARAIGVVGVGSLDALASAAAGFVLGDGDSPVETVAAVVDARRGEVFAAAYDLAPARARGPSGGADTSGPGAGGGRTVVDLAPATEDRPAPLAPDELADWLHDLADGVGSVLVVGDGAGRYLDRLAPDPSLDVSRAATFAAPSPSTVARLAARRLAEGATPVRPADLAADYRRPADARINWEQRRPRPVAPGRGTGEEPVT
jgi:tRNA threonylcarbamoyladenosine biosynthesis protein TsaB